MQSGASRSATATSWSALSPVLVTVIVDVTVSPTRTTLGSAVLVIATAGWMTSTVVDAEAVTSEPTGGVAASRMVRVTSSAGAVVVQTKSRVAPGSRAPSMAWVQPVAAAWVADAVARASVARASVACASAPRVSVACASVTRRLVRGTSPVLRTVIRNGTLSPLRNGPPVTSAVSAAAGCCTANAASAAAVTGRVVGSVPVTVGLFAKPVGPAVVVHAYTCCARAAGACRAASRTWRPRRPSP